jgi:hypothetical protein
MVLSDNEVGEIARLISHERLAAFVSIAGTERDALELHHQMMLLQGALSPIMGVIEIALRNAICERLRLMFGVSDWLLNPPPPFEWRGEEADAIKRAVRHARRAAYTKMSSAEKKALDTSAFPNGPPPNVSHETRVKRRQEAIQVTFGQIIAQLTLYFWKRLFSSDYEARLWQRSLKRLFPDKALKRGDIGVQLEILYQARNRLAHHEPLYGHRLSRLLGAIDFITQQFGDPGNDGTTMLARMIEPYRPALDQQAQAFQTIVDSFSV